jgi:hypothetical protein
MSVAWCIIRHRGNFTFNLFYALPSKRIRKLNIICYRCEHGDEPSGSIELVGKQSNISLSHLTFDHVDTTSES